MKKTFFMLVVALLAPLMLFAENETPRSLAKLNEATVYPSGATLTFTANYTVKQGTNELIIEGLSPNIDHNSLKVTASNGVIISSSTFSMDYLRASSEAKDLQVLRDSLKFYQNRQKQLERDIKVQNQMLTMLTNGTSNNMNLKEKTTATAEISANIELYHQKAPTYLAALDKANEQLTTTKDRIKALNNQISQDQIKVGQKRTGIVTLALTSPMAANTTFTIQYYTTQASWTPCYDIYVKDAKSNVELAAKANVQQWTGLDWNQVKLTLSNATPNRNVKAPILEAWMLDYYRPMYRTQNTVMYKAAAAPSVDADEVAFAEEEAYGIQVRGVASTNASAQPLYVVNGQVFNGDISSIDPNSIASTTILKDATATSLYGSRGANGVVVITLKSMDDYVAVEEKEQEVNYAIALPYTIPGNSLAQTIDLKKHSVKADFFYYTAPKMDEQVFLMAKLNDWENLHLLDGQATINYQGTFLGTTHLSTQSVNKEINLSLTQEKNIAVKRVLNPQLSSSKTSGNTTTVTRSYTITLKNNRTTNATVMVKDQYPVSLQKDIEVKVSNITPEVTTNNESTGIVTWETTLAPGQSKEFVITYIVKYPKDRTVELPY